MEGFVRGDVVVLPFPFSDFSDSKLRPALVIVSLPGEDLILCAISSQLRQSDPWAVQIKSADFKSGSLKRESYVRGDHLFTGASTIVEYRVGALTASKSAEVIDRIIR